MFYTLTFDHCGGAIERKKNGALSPAFKNAVFGFMKITGIGLKTRTLRKGIFYS